MRYLEKPALLSLLSVARQRSERDWLAILVGYSHALRASEICGLTPENVRDGFLTIQRLKGSLKTVQNLVENVEPLLNEKPALESLARATAPNARLFPITRVHFWRLVQKYGESAGLPAHLRHPHVLKSSCGMAVIAGGIEFARQYLGHRSLASTGEYLRVSDQKACDKVQKLL